jgi:PKD repeat protein
MKKSIFLLLLLTVNSLSLYSQLIKKVVGYNTGNYTNGANMMSVVDNTGALYQMWSYNQGFIAGIDTIDFIGGNNDYALAKYDQDGNLLWTTNFGNTSSGDEAWSFTMNSANHLIFGTINNGPLYFKDTIISPSTGGVSRYIIELDTAGDFIAKKEFANLGTFSVSGTNIYYYEKASSPLWQDKLIKLDSNSTATPFINFLTNTGASNGMDVRSIQTAPNGDLLIHGLFTNTFQVGSFSFGTYGTGNPAGFVCRIDTSGNVVWAERLETTDAHFVCDSAGNSYTYFETGHCTSPIWRYGNITYNNCPGEGSMVLKLDNTGQVIWQQRYYSIGGTIMTDMDLILNNQQQLLLFGGKAYNSGVYPVAPYIAGIEGMFVMKLDATTGAMIWTIPVGTGGHRGNINTSDFETYFLTAYFSEAAPYQCATPNIPVFWSGIVTLKDTVPPSPNVGFWYISNGNVFSFHDSVFNATSLSWNFGDGTSSTSHEPVHIYSTPGIYEVCLTAANSCGVQQKCKTITFKGLRAIETNHAGNAGYTTCSVYGGGFDSLTTILLKSTGNPDIIPDTVVFVNSSELIVRFNLNNQPLGLYDVEVTVPGDTVMTLVSGFTIEAVIPFDATVEIYGGGGVRTSGYMKFEISITNNGNIDAYLIPLQIYGIPFDSLASFNIQVYDQISEFNLLESSSIDSLWDAAASSGIDTSYLLNNLRILTNDTLNMEKHFGLLIPRIDANSKISLTFFLRSNTNVAGILSALVGGPIIENDSSLFQRRSQSTLYNSVCYDNTLNAVADILSFVLPGSECFKSVAKSLINTTKLVSNGLTGKGVNKSALLSLGLSSASALFFCNPIGASATKILIATRYVYYVSQIKAGTKVFSGAKVALSSGNALGNCVGDKLARGSFFWSNSIDPNFKSGSQGYNGSPYINNKSPLSYQIHFENVDTAALPAQKVIIIDTLDLTKIDISTFKWGSFSIGDTIIGVNNLDKDFVEIVDLTSVMPYKVKVEGIIDTTAGVLKWIFTTLNPITLEPDTSFIAGFLPPNTNDPDGTGFVNYSVKMKSTNVTGDVINNTAEIIFDSNAPVITNTWQNIVDITNPTSNVNPLSPFSGDSILTLTLTGSDIIAGVHHYEVYVSINDSAYQLFTVTDTNVVEFAGTHLSKYEFYSIAIDSAGNIEDAPVDPDNFPDAVTTITVGANEINSTTAMQIIPNPANDMVTVTMLSSVNRDYTIEILDVQGRTLFVYKIDEGHQNQSLQINTVTFNNGLYYIKASSKEFKYVQKLTVLH